MGQRAVPDVDDLVRAVRAQPGHAVRTHRELHPGPPAKPRRALPRRLASCGYLSWLVVRPWLVPRQRLHDDLVGEAGQPPQVLAEHRGLQRALGGQRHMLPVAAAAAAGMGVRARRLNPVGGPLKDLDGLGAEEPRRDLGHAGDYSLTGQRVPHEHHRKTGGPGDAPPALRYILGHDLDRLTNLKTHGTVTLLLGSHSPRFGHNFGGVLGKDAPLRR